MIKSEETAGHASYNHRHGKAQAILTWPAKCSKAQQKANIFSLFVDELSMSVTTGHTLVFLS
jgi:hypothetical protein